MFFIHPSSQEYYRTKVTVSKVDYQGHLRTVEPHVKQAALYPHHSDATTIQQGEAVQAMRGNRSGLAVDNLVQHQQLVVPYFLLLTGDEVNTAFHLHLMSSK